MKLLVTKILIAIGLISVFKGVSGHIEAHAKEASSQSAGRACGDTIGGRSGGCGKSG